MGDVGGGIDYRVFEFEPDANSGCVVSCCIDAGLAYAVWWQRVLLRVIRPDAVGGARAVSVWGHAQSRHVQCTIAVSLSTVTAVASRIIYVLV